MPPPSSSPGLFLVFEGLDGSGKSTQCRMLAEALRQREREVVETREPTQGPWGKKIRAMAASGQRVSPEEELDWFIQDRKEHIATLITPSLNAGKVVIQDRYYFSTAAYQGSRGLDVQEILTLHESFAPPPDRVFLIEVSPEVGLKRVQVSRGETPDAFETLAGLQRCGEVFDGLQIPGLVRINGELSPNEIHQRILEEVLPLL
ncbi:MAG: dTMP kinase [Deltaproteobacteria bacterium]|nr:MAG: dTMP kinase [Deltaproteobacteria bacterium]